MRLVAIALTVLVGTACVADQDTAPQPDDPAETTPDPRGSVIIPNELRLQPPTVTATAHSNCGHMVYCSYGGRAIYCYYKQSVTGCSLQNIIDDFNSDCQYVCGHTLCLNATIESCSSI